MGLPAPGSSSAHFWTASSKSAQLSADAMMLRNCEPCMLPGVGPACSMTSSFGARALTEPSKLRLKVASQRFSNMLSTALNWAWVFCERKDIDTRKCSREPSSTKHTVAMATIAASASAKSLKAVRFFKSSSNRVAALLTVSRHREAGTRRRLTRTRSFSVVTVTAGHSWLHPSSKRSPARLLPTVKTWPSGMVFQKNTHTPAAETAFMGMAIQRETQAPSSSRHRSCR
mmetsp:Transcript_61993/g.184654  ORF Transcript_61993/g.184654 Transcript_61993/m.184654 type:complete len:229 (+) Transcript_61993:1081-1767(+)